MPPPVLPPTIEDVGGIPGGAAVRTVLEVGHNEDGSNVELFRALGFKAINHDPRYIGASKAGTSGVSHGSFVMLQKGDVITRVGVGFTVVGSGLTLSKVGIYDRNLNLVAVSANDTTFGTVAGYRDLPLAAPYTVPVTDVYYLADLCVGGVIPAYLAPAGGLSPDQSQMPVPGAPLLYWQQAGLADLPAVAVPAQSQHVHLYYAK